MAKLLSLGTAPVNEGERLVVDWLRNELPSTYTLIANVELAYQGRMPYDYDLIVLAPHALYVIETKQWRGGIRGNDYAWTVANRDQRPNPFTNANNKARVLKSRLSARQPTAGLWVQAVVAIADGQGVLDIQGAARPWTRRYTDLPDLLIDPLALPVPPADLRPLRGPLENDLRALFVGRQSRPRHIGDYEIVETLLRRDHVAEYLARNRLHDTVPPARLRVFSYDPYLPEADRQRRMAAIRRDVLALQQIGPHPNLVAASDLRSDPFDSNLLFTVGEWAETGTLRDVLAAARGPLPLNDTLELAQGITAGLVAVHAAGVIHRDLRPEHVLIGPGGTPRLMNFDHARLPVPTGVTVGPPKPDPDVSRAYVAPELLNPAHPLTASVDLYSLGVILFEMLTGAVLFDTPEDALRQNTSAGGPRALAAIDIPKSLNDLIARLCQPDPARRPQTASETLDAFRAISRQTRQPTPLDAPPTPTVSEPTLFQPGQIIGLKYQVRRVIGSGGFSTVYEVYDEILDRVAALKLFKQPDISLDHLRQEAAALRGLNHPNVAKPLDWGILSHSNRAYLVSEFVVGEELTAYTQPDRRLGASEASRAIMSLLATLGDIHPDVDRIDALDAKGHADELTAEEWAEREALRAHGIFHRDIKPANLILTADGEIKLVDFNIAALASAAGVTQAGTPSYMLPEAGIMPWNTDADLFATGIVLYELITGHHPYPDRRPTIDSEPTDPSIYAPELLPAFTSLLLRAISFDPAVRYHSARQFHADLEALGGRYVQPARPSGAQFDDLWGEGPPPPNTNPFVTHLLTLYSQARHNNSGTRGLAPIARHTYVETRLDHRLQPAALNGRYRLIIITGNAGDGKTAFIQNLERQVENEGGVVARPTTNSSRFTYRGIHFTTNYDGSQDEGADRLNGAVLSEFFAPFADDPAPTAPQTTHIIAINKGRLLDFFLDQAQTTLFSRLAAIVNSFFDPTNHAESDPAESAMPNWLTIIDLNYRSVVAIDPERDGHSIFDRQLDALLQPVLWAPCGNCALRARCFIKHNADTLADPVSGPTVRTRLGALFEIVHLRRKLHITMRDMRSALSWLLARDHDCADVAALLAQEPTADDHARLLYYNAFADDDAPGEGRSDDRLVRLLRQIDPAQVSNPADDRALHSGGQPGGRLAFEERSAWPAQLLEASDPRQGDPAPEAPAQQRRRHAMLRRRAFYERRDNGWRHMLPYRALRDFQAAVADLGGNTEAVRQTLAQGISRAEGTTDKVLSAQNVCLRASHAEKARVRSFRLFPVEEFALRLPLNPNGQYLEYAPDQILFRHEPPDATLRTSSARPAQLAVSLDVLELLTLIADGHRPSPDDAEGVYVNLTIFKNALAHLPYRRALLTRDNRDFYEVERIGPGQARLRPSARSGEMA